LASRADFYRGYEAPAAGRIDAKAVHYWKRWPSALGRHRRFSQADRISRARSASWSWRDRPRVGGSELAAMI